jgi:hypothetical protein
MHLVGYLYEDYQDARSLEHKVHQNVSTLVLITLAFVASPNKPHFYEVPDTAFNVPPNIVE